MSEIKFSKKHRIKEDRFVETVFHFQQWVTQNARQLVTTASVLLVAGIIVFFISSARHGRNDRAHEDFGKAVIALQAGDTSSAVPALEGIVKRAAKSPYGAMSCFLLAGLYYERQDYSRAEDYFGRNAGGSYELLKGGSLRGLGHCAIQRKNYAEAVTYYERFLKDCNGHFLTPEVLLSLGECCLKLGNAAGASQAFQRIVKEYPQSAQHGTARKLLVTL